MLPLLFVSLLTVAPPTYAAPAAPSAASVSDIQATTQSMQQTRTALASLPKPAHDEVVATLKRLVQDDPFTRVSFQLPLVMNETLGRVEAHTLDPAIRAEWRALQQGVALHVTVLEDLGVELQTPGPGTALHALGSGTLPDADALRSDTQRLARTQDLVDSLVALSRAQQADHRLRIEADSARVEALTGVVRPCGRDPHHASPGQPWTLGMELSRWADALRDLRPKVADAELAKQLDAILELYDGLSKAQFAVG